MEPADPEALELARALRERHGGEWEVWRGVNGLLYAWWRRGDRVDPLSPLRWRGENAGVVLAQVGEYVASGKRPDY